MAVPHRARAWLVLWCNSRCWGMWRSAAARLRIWHGRPGSRS